VVICGAGPSLEKGLAHLKDLQERYLIIADDAAYSRVLAAGVSPDLVISGDPQEKVADFFECHRPGDLVAMAPYQSPATIDMIPDTDSVFFTDWFTTPEKMPFLDWAIQTFFGMDIEYYGGLMMGGNVTSYAISLAVRMGAGTVIFIGENLSFESRDDRRDRTELCSAKDMHGNWVLTSVAFLAFRHFYEDVFFEIALEEGYPKFVNATGDGILINKCEVLEPGKALKKYAGAKRDYAAELRGHIRDYSK